MNGRHLRTALGVMLAAWISSSGAARAAPSAPVASDPATGHSAAAFYNAGNAEARAGHPALAVLDYERARLLAPTDPDIVANLRHVRESVGLPPRTGGWLAAHARLADPNVMYWLGVFGLVCAGVSVVLLRARRQRAVGGTQSTPEPAARRYRAVLRGVAFVGGLITLVSVGDALATNALLHEYVVLDTAPATGSPVSNGAPLFTLAEADVVHARDAHHGFLLVTDSQGRQGWVAGTHLAPVVAEAALTRTATPAALTRAAAAP
jgi:hypothetical protein